MKFKQIIILFFCFCLKNGVNSLHEDQIGKFDWRLQLIGKVTQAVYDSSSDKDGHTKRIYAITDQNVLAGLNWFTGELVWRHVFEQSEIGRVNGLLLSQAGDIVTLSGGGQYLMNWERHRGTLRWSTAVSNDYCETSKMVEYKNGHIAVLSSCTGVLSAYDRSGGQSWTLSLQKHVGGDHVRWREIVAGGGGEILVLGEDTRSSSLVVLSISTSGTVTNSISKNIPYNENRVTILSNPNRILWIDATTGLINSLVLSTTTSSANEPFAFAIPGVTDASHLRLINHAGRQFTLTDGDRVWIPIKTSSDQSQSKEEFRLEKLDGSNVGFVTSNDNSIYASVVTLSARGGFSVRFYDTKSGKSMNEWDVVVPSTEVLSTPEKIYPFFQLKSDRTTNVAGVIVAGNDHSFALINQPGKIAWNRQEALASILSVEMLDLPLSEAQANIEEEFSTNGTLLAMLTRRVTTQIIQLQRVLLNAVNDIFSLAGLLGNSGENLMAPFGSGGGRSGEKNVAERGSAVKAPVLERDYFNLHKMIVVATAAGKLYGLDNVRGTIVWQKYLPDVVPFSKLSRPVLPLYVLRTTAHYPYTAQCAIVGRNKINGNGVLITFNPIAGSEFQIYSMQYGAKQSFILPVVNEHELQGVGIIGDDLKVYVFPASVGDKFSTHLQRKPFVVFLTDNVGTLSGNQVVESAQKKDSGLEKNFALYEVEPIWKTALPLEKQGKLIGATMKRFSEQVHTQGRVLGDRSVLYKYVNPNLVASIAESLDSAGKSQMNIYLFDAVTGDIIFNAVHRRVTGPYHLVHCENWIVYTYWNEKARRNEVAVLELYEGKDQTDPARFSSLKPPQPPIVMRQAYVFPQGISALAVTDTEKGITSRHLLLSMPFGGILELSKAFLDPRRVLVPTMEQREEGLYPYIPDLPIVTEQIINYNQSVYNIRAIHTSPSGLESTSLILAYGLDIYFTRVTPSGTFDILKDDFDHWLIGCVLFGLFLSSAVAKKFARHRDVKSAWR